MKLELKELITKYPESLSDYKKLRAYILDLCPQYPRGLVQVIVTLFKENALRDNAASDMADLNRRRISSRLEREYGFSKELIERAFLLWEGASEDRGMRIHGSPVQGVIHCAPGEGACGCLLSEISDIAPVQALKKVNSGVLELACAFGAEYVIGNLGYAPDDDIYGYIRDYFLERNITSERLIQELWTIPELETLLSLFPRDRKDFKTWTEITSSVKWENDGERNILTRGDVVLRLPAMFAMLFEGNEYTAARYSYVNGRYVFVSVGKDSVCAEIPTPYIFNRGKAAQSRQNGHFVMTESEFFEISGDLKMADKEQRAAITADTTRDLLVLAGAGSGKTRTLVCRLAYLNLVKGIPLERIILLTFTNAAADEMKKRAEDLLNPIYMQKRSGEKPSVNARTIDSFCKYIMDTYWVNMGFTERPGYILGSDSESENRRISVLNGIIAANNLRGLFSGYYDENTGAPSKSFRYLIGELESYAMGMPGKMRGLDSLLGLYVNYQKSHGVILGFVYINMFVRDAIQSNESLAENIRARYNCILIDEFQDINNLQYETFSAINCPYVHFSMVGDDDQSIYHWRGADSQIIKNLSGQTNVNTIYLLTNYRNNPYIVNAGNSILKLIEDRAKTDKSIIAHRQTGSKIRVAEYDSKFTNLVNEVQRLIDFGCKPEDVCVLYRTNAIGNAVAEALSAADIPIDKDAEAISIDDNYRLLKAILNILTGAEVAASCKKLRELSCDRDVKHTDRYYYKLIKGKVHGKIVDCDSDYPLSKIKELADTVRVNHYDDLADVVNNFSIKAAELFENKSNEEHSDPVFSSFELFCKNNGAVWPIKKTTLFDLFKVFEENNGRAFTAANNSVAGVKLATVHRAKGLEYKAVFIVGLNRGEYPDFNRIDKEYRKNEARMRQLEESKDRYAELKSGIDGNRFNLMLAECDSAKTESANREYLANFKKFLIKNSGNILGLSADGVEDFIDAYRACIETITENYAEKISLADKQIASLNDRIDEVEDELLIEEDGDNTESENKKLELENQLREIVAERDGVLHSSDRFKQSVPEITGFYSTCIKAKGFLIDIADSTNIQSMRNRILRDKKVRENEERRTFYVAITRAIDYLYLLYAQGKTPSEFIKEIPEELRTEYHILTIEEERDIERLKSELDDICTQPETKVDDARQSELIEQMFDKQRFHDYVEGNIASFYEAHSLFKLLTPNAQKYFNKAIGLLYLSDYVGVEFKAEFIHNIQRCFEVYLREIIGRDAKQVKVDGALAREISARIRDITKKCITSRPGEQYLIDLLENKSEDAFSSLKGLGIMHFVVRSGYWKLDKSIISSWHNLGMAIDPAEFLVSVVDIANLRNKLIHENAIPHGWPADYIPVILKKAENIVNSYTFNTAMQVKNDNLSGDGASGAGAPDNVIALDYSGIKNSLHQEVLYFDKTSPAQNVPAARVMIESAVGGKVTFVYLGGNKNGKSKSVSMQVAVTNKSFCKSKS